jgi:hypothetical protein
MDGIFHHRILRADAGSYLPNPYVQFSTNPDPDPDSSADIRRVTEWLNAESTVDLAAQPPARWSIPLDLPADSSWRTGIPVIPAWFLELSDQQRRAWNELEAAFAVGRIEETRSQISGIRSATHDDRQGR